MIRAAGQDAGFGTAVCQIDVHALAGMQSGGIRYEFSVGVTNNGKAPGQGDQDALVDGLPLDGRGGRVLAVPESAEHVGESEVALLEEHQHLVVHLG